MNYVENYYTATMNPHAPRPVLQESIQCDVCIIGAGFTGLSAGLFLTEAGYDVVLLEAARVGFGASGRNGGQAVNSYSRDVDVIEQRYGKDTAKMLGSMMFEGGDIIRDRIDRYAIACDYRPGGIFAAFNSRQMAHLAKQKRPGRAMAIMSWNCWTNGAFGGKSRQNAMSADYSTNVVRICIH